MSLKVSKLRTTIISKVAGRYRSFPDICRTNSGKLLCVFRDADIHYPATKPDTFLLLTESSDNGNTWSTPRYFPHDPKDRNVYAWHCPRLIVSPSGDILLSCDLGSNKFPPEVYVSVSKNEGVNWSSPVATGLIGILPDRILMLSEMEWLLTAHWPNKTTKKLQQILYATLDGGITWQQRAIIANDPRFDFCEGNLLKLPSGEILCYLRENSFVHFPTFVARSKDNGKTWSAPAYHPTHGHRVTTGLLAEDTVLITYRDVSGIPGLAAWIGAPGAAKYEPHLRAELSHPQFTDAGLVIETDSDSPFELFLHPLTKGDDFELMVRLSVASAAPGALIIQAGLQFSILEDRVTLETPGPNGRVLAEKEIDCRQTRTFRIAETDDELDVTVDDIVLYNGAMPSEVQFPCTVSIGNQNVGEKWQVYYRDNTCRAFLQEVTLRCMSGDYLWHWKASSKMVPNHYQATHEVLLEPEYSGNLYESGYSGWVLIDDHTVYCVDYQRNHEEKPYIVGHTLHLSKS